MTNSTIKAITIKQAMTITPEELASMPLTDLQSVADTLSTSSDKKAGRKLDLVQGTLNARKKEAKEAGDVEAQKEVQAVENSVKRKRKSVPKKPQPKTEQAELVLESDEPEEVKIIVKETHTSLVEDSEEIIHEQISEQIDNANLKELRELAKEYQVTIPTKLRVVAKVRSFLKDAIIGDPEAPEKVEPKKVEPETDDLKAIKKKMAELEKENAKLKAEVFPARIERQEKPDLVAQNLLNVQDVQKVLIDRPYELLLYAHEGLDEKPTAFTVLYMNEDILVLLDRSREKNSTLTLLVKDMKPKSVKIDKRDCPYVFYLSEK